MESQILNLNYRIANNAYVQDQTTTNNKRLTATPISTHISRRSVKSSRCPPPPQARRASQDLSWQSGPCGDSGEEEEEFERVGYPCSEGSIVLGI